MSRHIIELVSEMHAQIDRITSVIEDKLSRAFQKCFPVLQVIVGLLNVLVAICGTFTVLAAVLLYIIPKWHLFIDSLKHIFNVHSIFGSIMWLGAFTTTISFIGLYLLRKKEYEKLGLQGASFLILIIVMTAIMFTFYVEWEEKSEFGMSYATQIYSPQEKHSRYLESIQKAMHCCGSRGPKDFDIGNEYFKKGTVPVSCCNFKSNSTTCSDKLTLKDTGKGSLSIPIDLAFPVGCMERLEIIVWPSIVFVLSCQFTFAILCMVTTSILCVGYDSYIVKKTSQSNNLDIPLMDKLSFTN